MDKNISTPWAVTIVVVVLLIVGGLVWRGMAPRTPVPAGQGPGQADYSGRLGHPGYPPPTPLPPGAR
jgi:hypothetical protein